MNDLIALVGSVAGVLLLTSFAKIFTALTIMRQGIGIVGSGFGLVLAGLAFVLSLVVVTPQLESIEVRSFSGLVALFGGTPDGVRRDGASIEAAFTPFLEAHTQPDVLMRFEKLAGGGNAVSPVVPTVDSSDVKPAPIPAKRPFTVTLAAFMVSELRLAFQIGLILLIPFIVIDLLVINVLMALGITQVSPTSIALPLKLLLFVAIDGWALLTTKLIG